MNITVNILDKDKARNLIFIFINDYKKNKKKYRNFSIANELTQFTATTISCLCQQNINSIVSDNLEHSIHIAENHNFKNAIILYPGTSLGNSDLQKILSNKDSNRMILDSDQNFIGYLIKIGSNLSLPNKKLILTEPSIIRQSDTFKKNIISLKELKKSEITLDSISSQYSNYLDNINTLKPLHTRGRRLKSCLLGRKVYLFNNEDLYEPEVKSFEEDSIDAVIVPSGGFFANKLIYNAKIQPSNIVYYDSFETSLLVKQYINEKLHNIETLNDIKCCNYISSTNEINSMYKLNTESFNIIKNLNKDYLMIDIIKDPDIFINSIAQFERPWVWLSNIYTFNVNLYLHGPSYIRQSFEYLIFKIKNNLPNAIIQGKTPSGKYFSNYAESYSSNFYGFTPNWERE